MDNTSVIVRKKDSPGAPVQSVLASEVNLDAHDVVDEHGNLVGDEVIEGIRAIQSPKKPDEKKPEEKRREAPQPVATQKPVVSARTAATHKTSGHAEMRNKSTTKRRVA